MKSKKAAFSLIEIALSLVLIGGITIYGINSEQDDYQIHSNQLQAKTFLHTFNFSKNQRDTISKENMSSQIIQQNWSNIENAFSKQFLNYGLFVGNITDEKQIIKCKNYSSQGRKSFQRLLFFNNSVYTKKTLRLEVCY